ncbi:MAG: nucleotidyltransferase [Clostridiaceae bacterium]|nr:nucleotidyltransferase [Clostridiaceae bacterium]
MKAIIMAGGEGTRLRPLTCNIPKPMMPILGKPTMDYAIELLRKNGIIDIGVTLQYLPDEVISHYGDGKDYGVNLRYFIEETPLGTAGSVKNAELFLDDTFIVISGDALTDIDLSEAVEYHKRKKAMATLILKEVTIPLEYGVVVTNKQGRVTGFLEKPSWSEVFSDKVNTGMYILEPEIFSCFETNEKFDFSNDLFPILLNENKPMYGFVTEDYWCDIGNIEQYRRCNLDILKGLVKVEITGNNIRKGIFIGENCEIDDSVSLIPPIYIGSNCKIYGNVNIGPFSIIGKNNIISSGSSIIRSIFFDNCYAGNNVEVKGAVICNKVQLESRVSVFEEATIGDDTLVGERAIIKPGVSIWPNKIVEASTIVKANVIWGGKFSKALFGKNGISGEVNIDITPEFVSKLGSSYGSLLKSGSKVAISCSDNGAAQMFKYSLATGLLSMGAEVYDLKRMTTSMTRQASIFFGVQGAIHVVIDKDEPQRVNILFMDKNGLNIHTTMERKIEHSFIREDFRRVKTDTIKSITHLSDCLDYYIRQIVNQLDINNIKLSKLKIVLSARNTLLISVIEKMLSEINVSVRVYDEYRNLYGLIKEVVTSGASLGIFLEDEAEEAIFIDEKGNIIKDGRFETINALVLLKSTKINSLIVPVTASAALKDVAEICGVQFARTKTSQKSILDYYFKLEKKLSKREVANTYLMSLDRVSTLMFTLNYMSISKQTLSEINSLVPKYYSKTREINCPWNLKGRVMRSMIEESTAKSVDLIEGVKLNYENSWALVIPDSDEPICRVYTESMKESETERLNREISEKILAITGLQIEE